MNKNSLILGRALFLLIVIISFGIIIINEKGGKIFIPKVSNNINSYIDKKYTKIKDKLNIESIKYNNKVFTTKITSKENKHLFFYVTYKNKKISDTYKKDYQEGRTLLNHINKENEKTIYNKTNQKCKVFAISTLDKYTEKVRKELINEKNLYSLKYYYIEKELQINNWTPQDISNEITSYINLNIGNNIHPKYYKIIVTNNKDITNSIELSNITENFVSNDNEKIINDIINKNVSNELKNSKIKYRFLNEEE